MSDGIKRFETGAVRSSDAEGERWDLISPIGLREVAKTCAEGARKYNDFNWERGMAAHDLLNHAVRHIYLFLEGDRSEPHLPHAAWGVLAAIHSLACWPHLNEGTLRGPGCRPPGFGEVNPDPPAIAPTKAQIAVWKEEMFTQLPLRPVAEINQDAFLRP